MTQTDRPTSIVLAGGGTTGHIAPLLATGDALRRLDPQAQVTVLGARGGLEETLVPQRGYDLRLIEKVAFPRRPDGAALRFPLALRQAVLATGRVLDETRANVVAGFGGYVSPPAFLAARRRRIPMVVHEQNARPGLANRLGARMTPYVATTFASTRLPGATRVGLPMRSEVTRLDREALRASARTELGLDPQARTVLVTGGSLGAQRINDAFRQAAVALLDAGVQVLHVTGRGKQFEPPQRATGPRYVVLEYADHMEQCYAAADLVVTRAGAGMVCETSTLGLPAVFVPLPIGNGEQRLNAADVVSAGGAQLVDNDAFTPAWVTAHIPPLLSDQDRLDRMGEAALSQGHQDADQALAAMILDAARARRP